MSWITTFPNIDYDIMIYGGLCTPCLFGENSSDIHKHPSCKSNSVAYMSLLMTGNLWGNIIGNAIVPGSFTSMTIANYLCTGMLVGIYGGEMRTKLRNKYNINGNQIDDSIFHCLCPPLATCQEAQEIRNRKETPPAILDLEHDPLLPPSAPPPMSKY